MERGKHLFGGLLRNCMMEIILLVLAVVLALNTPHFLTTGNLLNLLRNVSMQGIIAFGMTMLIICGEIDLSVGSAVAFAGCLLAFLTEKLAGAPLHLPLGLALVLSMVVVLAVGFSLGLLTGLLRIRFNVPTFISTLALLTVLSGAAYLMTGGFPLAPFPPWFNFLGGGYLVGIPFPALVFLAVFALTSGLMHFTSFGRAIYAVGGNAEAARLSGIRVGLVKTLTLGLTAALAAFAGILQASEIMSGTASTARGWELDVIAAVIIGGTSLMGGVGRIWGTLIGVMFLGVIMNGMTLLNVNEYWQLVVRGALILTAVLINRLQLTTESAAG